MRPLGLNLQQLLSNRLSERMIRSALPFLGMVIFGYIAILAYSLGHQSRATVVAGIGLLLAGACSLFGGCIGFLFGIPRTNINAFGDKQEVASRIQDNTNLEQISDWLTKILVGLGLAQVRPILSYIYRTVVLRLAPAMTIPISKDEEQNMRIAIGLTFSLIVFFVSSGFFLGYLWARIYLTESLREEYRVDLERRIKAKEATDLRIHLLRVIVDLTPDLTEESFGSDYSIYGRSSNHRQQFYQMTVQATNDLINRLKNQYKKQEIPESLDEFIKDITESDREGKEFYFLRVTDYIKLGNLKMLNGEYQKSIKLYDRAISINNSIKAYNLRGLAYWRLGRYEEAMQTFHRTVELRPSFAPGWCNLCGTLLESISTDPNISSDDVRERAHVRERAQEALNYGRQGIKYRASSDRHTEAVTYAHIGMAFSYLERDRQQEIDAYDRALAAVQLVD